MIFKLNQRQLRTSKMGWVTTPNYLIDDLTISPEAKQLLLYMLTKNGKWVFRQNHLCKKFDVNRSTISRWYAQLKNAEYLYCEDVPDKINGNKRVWTYLVFPLPMALYYQVANAADNKSEAKQSIKKILYIDHYHHAYKEA